MKSLSQIRAARAFEWAGQPQNRSLLDDAVKLPAMLRQNGLLATYAALHDKGSLLKEIGRHLAALRLVEPRVAEDAIGPFLTWVGSHPSGHPNLSGQELRRLTDEVASFAEWLKRAAEAYRGESTP